MADDPAASWEAVQTTKRDFSSSNSTRSTSKLVLITITPSLFTCNALILEYSKSSSEIESLKSFIGLWRTGIKPDKFVFPSVLKSDGCCSIVGAGGSVRSMSIKKGFSFDVHVNNALLKMYAACGVIAFARKVFEEMSERDMVS
ncbi:unnamed protein product [Cuscuta europaea]|uniref:Pentatricopeptide repeat-containing protein n=1 Tax=Cuscuta europaea TaxID=41803 RepID=A0A9P0YQP3_CUSEU|nr:unnamed protein product [Cuscuta europaea]